MKDGGLGKLFSKHLPEFHWQPIESNLIIRGIPDRNYCCEGREGWIELKRTKGFTVPLRPEQIGWLLRRSRAGGRCFIAVRQEQIDDTLWLIFGAHAGIAKTLGLRDDQIWPRWAGGPQAWDWKAIKNTLIS